MAIAYEHPNYGGKKLELAVGKYDMNYLIGKIGNDVISSLKVSAGYEVILYEDVGFRGAKKTFRSDVAWVGDDFNDKTSSIEVRKIPR